MAAYFKKSKVFIIKQRRPIPRAMHNLNDFLRACPKINSCLKYKLWLFLCFGGLSEQHAEQGGQEMFAPNTGIVHEFEKAQVQG